MRFGLPVFLLALAATLALAGCGQKKDAPMKNYDLSAKANTQFLTDNKAKDGVKVTADGIAVDQINELEVVGDEIFANIWHTNTIARIDQNTGKIVGWIDLGKLYPEAGKGPNSENVLNGIAWDADKKRLFVTGKLWPKLYEIKLVPRK